jgi:D-sedoheptulose 7-phosphate isomerase
VSSELARLADGPYPAAVDRAIELIGAALAGGHTVLIFGNGGSAADAQHIAAELVGRFVRTRAPLPAVALGSNVALTTAWSNDVGYEDLFARELSALGRPGDIAWGISTSGNSPNVVAALRRARELGLTTVGMSGATGGAMASYCDLLLAAPATETARIQEVHVITYHAICAALETQAPPLE